MISIHHEKFCLSNGLEVILHEDHSLPNVAVNIWYHVGSKDEEIGRTGFAHLFEHIMFEGSKHHNKNYFEPLQKVGATVNGSTTADRTNYWENLPSGYLDLALWLESDRMGFLLDSLDQNRFEIQRDVVKNERRQSYENRPYGISHLLLQPKVFPAPHPYNWPVIGSQADLDAASLDDVKAFFRKFYAPSNASLAITGDFDSGSVIRRIEHYFGNIAPGPAINRVGRMDSTLVGETQLTFHDKIQLPRLYLIYPTIPIFDPDEAPIVIMSMVMGDGRSSRLYQSLVHEKQIARDVSVGYRGHEIAGELEIQATANPGHSLESLQEVIEHEVTRLLREGLSQHEIDRAKHLIASRDVRALEQIGGFGGRADQLNYYNVMAGDPNQINEDIGRFNMVSHEDILRVCDSTLSNNRVRLALLSEEANTPSKSSINRTSIPKSSTSPSFSPPTPTRTRISTGLNILHIQKKEIPLVTLGVVFNTGAVDDPIDKYGLSHMTSALIPEGTSTRSSKQISEEIEFIGSELSSTTSREQALLSFSTLPEHLPIVFELMSDILQNATFPPQEYKRIQRQLLADISRLKDDPVIIAQRLIREILYGSGSRYGHPISGTEQSVGKLTRSELDSHFRNHYKPGNATLLTVGDVSHDDLIQLAENHFGNWRGVYKPSPYPADINDSEPGTKIYLVDRPGSAQSVIRVGHLMMSRKHPDYNSSNLINYIFGGNPSSRLFSNLREDKGYSYGYYSQIDWLSGPSVLLAGGSVETGVTKEAVVETLKEFQDLHGIRPITRKEFDTAKEGIFNNFPARFETQSEILHQLSNLVRFNLPDNYYSTLMQEIDSVTLENIHRVSEQHIGGSDMAVLIVGDRKKVDSKLRDINLPVVHLDHNGNSLK